MRCRLLGLTWVCLLLTASALRRLRVGNLGNDRYDENTQLRQEVKQLQEDGIKYKGAVQELLGYLEEEEQKRMAIEAELAALQSDRATAEASADQVSLTTGKAVRWCLLSLTPNCSIFFCSPSAVSAT